MFSIILSENIVLLRYWAMVWCDVFHAIISEYLDLTEEGRSLGHNTSAQGNETLLPFHW